jgi:membrane protein
MTLKDLWEILTETWNAWSIHKAPSAGAALAYYTLFSLAPLLVIVIAVAALVFGQEAAQGKIVSQDTVSRVARPLKRPGRPPG